MKKALTSQLTVDYTSLQTITRTQWEGLPVKKLAGIIVITWSAMALEFTKS